MTLKEKTVKGLVWSFIELLSRQGITFILGIILARLLNPDEFGLIAMTSIFFAVSQMFISSGFGEALVRKSDCTQADYSTVFYYNLVVSIVFSLLLFFVAGTIGDYFDEPQLKQIIRVLSVGLVVTSFTVVQQAILTRRVDFKLQTKISVISGLISGIVGIVMAIMDYGVWSLVAKMLLGSLITSALLWFMNTWRPSLLFSIGSFREMFSFGYKLLFVHLIDAIYRNVYYFIIGKFFSAADLGFYSRADQFSMFPAQNMTIAVQRVSYPVLSRVQEENDRLKEGYRKIILTIMFITFLMMMGLAAVSKPLIMLLLGAKWAPVTVYLQLLCIGTMLLPLQALNLNILNVKGRSDLALKIELFKKALAVPIIIAGIFWGIKYMILGIILNSFIAYYINSYFSGRLINYPLREQISDILPTFLLSLIISGTVYSLTFIITSGDLLLLTVQIITGILLTLVLSEKFKPGGYLELKEIYAAKGSLLKSLFR
ncbi:MAG: lipopolysaccharide biosynthesis protein [Bacteroidales bacterium]